MKNRSHSIVVINDHQLVTGLLGHYLADLGFGEIESHTNTETALDRILLRPPDLLIIDMMLPIWRAGAGEKSDLSDPYILMDCQVAFRMVRKIRDACPTTKILMLSGERHPHPFLLGFEAGAHGIASKLDPLHECVKILKGVMAGRNNVTSARMGILMEEYRQSPMPYLNPFEIQILELVQEGLESPEIGKELGYSAKTIRNAVSKINEKLGTSNRYKAMQKAVDMGLVGWRTGYNGD